VIPLSKAKLLQRCKTQRFCELIVLCIQEARAHVHARTHKYISARVARAYSTTPPELTVTNKVTLLAWRDDGRKGK